MSPEDLAAKEKADAAMEARASAAIAKAKSESDPWKAFEYLDAELKAMNKTIACEESTGSDRERCPEMKLETWGVINDLLKTYEAEAVKSGNPLAIVHSIGSTWGYDSTYTPSILEAADRAHGTVGDRQVLLIAGRLVTEGKTTIRDSRRAVGYFARAWAAGELQAANDASRLFLSMKDTRNAYLWALRCTSPCERDEAVALGALQAVLDSDAVKQAQEAALDMSTVAIDTDA